MQEDIKTPQAFLTVFPDAKDVFAEPVEKYAKHLHPLLSIDLSEINESWAGKIHLISPVEPYDGLMGDFTSHTHNDFLRMNWIGFKLNTDDKYELLGNFDYFLLENQSVAGMKTCDGSYSLNDNMIAELKKHYEDSHKGFAQCKQKYAEFGALYGDYGGKTLASKQAYYDEPYNLLDQLGGGARDANWTSYCDGIHMNMDDSDDIYPISPAGNRFYFIVGVPGYHYITNGYSGADWIVMFYEPIERLVWFTFDYS